MSKRFTDADKWRDPWFVDLPPMAKLVWLYLCDSCDIAGVWQVHAGLCAAAIGCPIDLPAMLTTFGDRVASIAGGKKWHLRKFLTFQYPRGLNPKVAAHVGVLRRLDSHGLPNPWEISPKGCQALQDKDTDKDQDKDSNAGARDPGELFAAAPRVPLRVVQNIRPPVSDLDHLRHAGAMMGKDEAGAWQLLVDDHGIPKVVEAIRACEKPFRSEVAKRLGAIAKIPSTPAFITVGGKKIRTSDMQEIP